MACLDTDVLVELMGGAGTARAGRARRFVGDLVGAGEPLATTRFTVAELLVGVHRSAHPEREGAKVAAVLEAMEVLEFDAACAERFGLVMAALLGAGAPVGDMDTLIACTAMRHGHGVVTRNVRHFQRIPGLVLFRAP